MKVNTAQNLLAGASWCAVVLLWLCAASVFISPVHCRLLGVVGLAFPFFLTGVLLMQALTLLFARRHAWIPLLGLAGAFFSIRAYIPFNFPSSPPEGAIKVISYNTACFGGENTAAQERHAITNYLIDAQADIVCLQEAATIPFTRYAEETLPMLEKAYPHHDTVSINSNIYAVFSRYPIVGKEVICHNGTNGSAAFKLLTGKTDTLLVVNCHLESMHLSPADRKSYHTMVRTPEESDVESSSRLLVSKISTASVTRAVQADIMADYLKLHEKFPVILCGDFNDTPISYTRRRILSQGLTDAYETTGNGFGRTFNRDAICVRIDHMMCSRHFKPYACQVDCSINASDHYPIVASFEWQKEK